MHVFLPRNGEQFPDFSRRRAKDRLKITLLDSRFDLEVAERDKRSNGLFNTVSLRDNVQFEAVGKPEPIFAIDDSTEINTEVGSVAAHIALDHYSDCTAVL